MVLLLPTSRMRPPLIATASATDVSETTVITLPSSRTRSAAPLMKRGSEPPFGAVAPCLYAGTTASNITVVTTIEDARSNMASPQLSYVSLRLHKHEHERRLCSLNLNPIISPHELQLAGNCEFHCCGFISRFPIRTTGTSVSALLSSQGSTAQLLTCLLAAPPA